jgi:hypothetical protein
MPKLHSRSYCLHPRGARPGLSNYTRKLSPKDPIPNADEFAVWGDTAVAVNRAYTALFMQWWRYGNTGLTPDEWASLAAIQPIWNDKGALVYATARTFFLWYQKHALLAQADWPAPYNPLPTYLQHDGGWHLLDFPCYPRLPWNPLAPQPIEYIHATSPNYIVLTLLPIVTNKQIAVGLLIGTYPPVNSLRPPNRRQLAGTGYIWPGDPAPHPEIDIDVTGYNLPAHPGTRITIASYSWSLESQAPSTLLWYTAEWV